MSSSFVTQCPHCRTRFRVNHAQLGAANGAVRCGACMHVFDAARHLLADQPVALSKPAANLAPKPDATAADQPAPSARKTVSGTPAGKAPSDTLWIHDDLDLDDLDLDEELAKLEREEIQFSKDFLALEKAPKPAQVLLSAEPVADDPNDERWAERLLNENSSAEAAMPPAELLQPAPDTAAPEDETEHPIDQAADPESETLDDSDWPRLDDTRDPLFGEDRDSHASEPLRAPRVETPSRPGNRSSFQLDDEPVQLDWRPRAKPRSRWLLWSLLNLLALALLASQYAYRHFDELARQDQYRPLFAQVCPLLGCTLPSKVDISQIKSSNLMVRAHPQFAGALIVDAILYNRAAFAQPFPLLEMRFADLQGQPVASRRFKPAEYLAGELAGQTEMPSQTPIRISLEILDPGRNAENYSLSFLSPE